MKIVQTEKSQYKLQGTELQEKEIDACITNALSKLPVILIKDDTFGPDKKKTGS